MEFKRDINAQIQKLLKYYKIIVITGARQTGKTYLAKKIFNDKEYVNLESLENREFAISDPVGFLNKYKNGAIFDEVQNVPKLFSQIQAVADQSEKKAQFVLTGSSNFKLLEGVTQSLAGRAGIIKIYPLSLSELSKESEVNELIINGFYPGKLKDNIPANIFYKNYIDTYIEKDLRLLENIKDLVLFRKFIQILAGRVGSIINFQSISNDIGVSQNTIVRWIRLLEVSYITYTLPPWFSNISKRLVKQPKIYFNDVGLLVNILGISNTQQLQTHPLYGFIFENFIINELFKHVNNYNYNLNLNFYRSYDGQEVDLIFEKDNKYNLLEIKSSHTFHSSFLRGVKSFEKISNRKIDKKIIILGSKYNQKRADFMISNYKDMIKDLFTKSN